MATESITKRFVIKDDAACRRLIKIIKDPNRKEVKIIKPDAYEDGKKLSQQLLSR